MLRHVPALCGLLALIFVIAVRADQPAVKKPTGKTGHPDNKATDVKDKTQLQQRLLRRQFDDFKIAVLRVKQRLEKGNADDRKKAKALQNALDHIDKKHLDAEMARLVKILDDKSLKSVGDVIDAMLLSKKLARELNLILSILRDDNLSARLHSENRLLAELINELDAIIRDQRIVRAKTEMKRVAREDLSRSQKNVSDRTEKFADKLAAVIRTKAGGIIEAITRAHKHIQGANQDQRAAEKNIDAGKRAAAGLDQNEAIAKLLLARKELEKILLQNREEELDNFLTTLESRLREMLALQRAVQAGTIEVHKAIQGNKYKKANRANQQDAGRLGDQEKDIVNKADKAIDIIEQEGGHIAFAEIVRQVRTDMSEVQKRLENTTVGKQTQIIEQDIIDTLEELIKALQNARMPPRPPEDGHPGPRPPEWIDKLADLKIIRSMQMKVNKRTKMYGNEYVVREGEQTANAKLREQLKELAERQAKLFAITRKLVKESERQP